MHLKRKAVTLLTGALQDGLLSCNLYQAESPLCEKMPYYLLICGTRQNYSVFR